MWYSDGERETCFYAPLTGRSFVYCFLPQLGQKAAPERSAPHPLQNFPPWEGTLMTLSAAVGTGVVICTTTGAWGLGRKQQHLQHHAHAVIESATPAMRPIVRPAMDPPSGSQHPSSEVAQQYSYPSISHHLSDLTWNAPQEP